LRRETELAMNRLKHNLPFASGMVVTLGLLMAAIWYGWSGWSNNARESGELNRGRAELQRLTQAKAESVGVQVKNVRLRCRAVDRSEVIAGANEQTAYVLDKELKRSPLFSEVKLDPQIEDGNASGTFTFGVTVRLKQPMTIAARD